MRAVMTRVLPVPAPGEDEHGAVGLHDGGALGVVEIEKAEGHGRRENREPGF